MTIKKAEIFYGLSCSIQLAAEVGQGEAEEPERSDGNRLYGSIADKKANGSKRITAFYDNKKSRNLLRLRLFYSIGSGGWNRTERPSGYEPDELPLLHSAISFMPLI